ncbi:MULTISPECIES: PucR family transcriptional regulator ligand-binding domain-containing protein [unclassified Streptomyces]|uniref:PucR family transcriptional regulator ligand-binding domain-containing protein n=1 Tax=unclassified Streptomyces TaxID=2593676 RepID=UPI003809E77C
MSSPRQDLAPPAPQIPLSVLLALPDLGLRQVAGPRAAEADVRVQWVHASEMQDPVPYLLGGELVLTAGVHLTAAVDAGPYLDRYVARTVEAGAAALGFGLAPVHDRIPAALAEACDRHGLPLLEVPPRTPFTAVARAVWQAMGEARTRELRHVTEAQQALAAAAARPDPVPAVLRRLAGRLGAWAALVGPDGSEVYAAGTAPDAGVRAAAHRLARVVGDAGPADAARPPSSATDAHDGTRLSAYALAGGGTEGRPALVLASAHPDPADHAVANVAAVLLSLLTGPHLGTAEAARSAALVRLLLGAAPEEVAPLLGPDGPWLVVHALRRGAPADPRAAAALGAALGTALLEAGDEAVRLLLPADREVAAQPGWTLGVSAPVPAAALADGDRQAAGAARRAVAGRDALVRHRGGHGGMADLVAPDDARARAHQVLAPVAGSPALVETLRTWIGLHGSWDRTALALGVHRNTVRQRIARAAAALDVDPDDPDVRMELWFALRWL